MGAAMAARIARPSSQVVLLYGDGAAGMSLMDVDTLVRHNLPVVMVVGNNSAWGLEKGPMQCLYGYDVAADLAPNTRYDQVVTALGGGGEMVTDPHQIGPAIDRAFASGVPYLVNVMTDVNATYPVPPPASDVVVRPVRGDELDAVGALTVAGYDADGYLLRPTAAYDHDTPSGCRRGRRGADGVLLVAADGDGAARHGDWCPPGSPFRELATGDHQGEFRTLSVAPEREAAASAEPSLPLGRRARDLGPDRGRPVLAAQMVPAHRLYASLGFVRRPDLDWTPSPNITLWGFSMPSTPPRVTLATSQRMRWGWLGSEHAWNRLHHPHRGR